MTVKVVEGRNIYKEVVTLLHNNKNKKYSIKDMAFALNTTQRRIGTAIKHIDEDDKIHAAILRTYNPPRRVFWTE